MKIIASFFLATLSLAAQIVTSGLRADAGATMDSANAAHSIPNRLVTSPQVASQACATVGETLLATDTGLVYACSVLGTPGTWALTVNSTAVGLGNVPNVDATRSANTPVATSSARGSVAPNASDFSVNPANGAMTINSSAKVVIDASFTVAGAVAYDPACGKLYPASGSSPCTATSAIATAASPSSLALAPGTSGTETVTYTATSLTGGIVPSYSFTGGTPTGVTVTFATNPLASTGGSTVATIATTAATPAGTYTITWGGTSGATSGATNATTVTSTLVVTLPTGSLTYSTTTWTDPHTVSASSLGWRVFGGVGEHKVGSSLVPDLPYKLGTDGTGGYPFRPRSIAWVNGASQTYGSSNQGAYFTGSPSITITLPDTSPHDIHVYFIASGGNSSGVFSARAHLSDSSSPDQTYTANGNQYDSPGYVDLDFSVQSSTAGASLTLTFSYTNINAFLQAIEVTK